MRKGFLNRGGADNNWNSPNYKPCFLTNVYLMRGISNSMWPVGAIFDCMIESAHAVTDSGTGCCEKTMCIASSSVMVVTVER
jgi:hypothetical protein